MLTGLQAVARRFHAMGDDQAAISKLNEASWTVGNIDDQQKAAEYYHLTALVYFNLKDYHNALVHNNASINLALEHNEADILERALLLSSRIYEKLYDYEQAMISFQDHLTVKDSLRRQRIMARQDLSEAQLRAEEITRETERLWAAAKSG